MFLLGPKRQISQPRYPANVDWSNPLAIGLVSVWTPFQYTTLSGSRQLNAGVPSVGKYGTGSKLNGTSQSVSLGATGLIQGVTTRLALIQVGSASGSRTISGGGNGSTGFRLNGTAVEIVNVGNNVSLTASAAVSASEYCCVAMASAPFDSAIYKNGVSISTGTGAGGSTDNGTNYIGQNGAGGQYYDGSIFLHLSWNRRLSDAEIRQISANPWQVIQAAQRRVWVAPAGSGDNNLLAEDCTQGNTCSDGEITQVHVLAVANCTQTNESAAGAIEQIHVLSGDNCTQQNQCGPLEEPTPVPDAVAAVGGRGSSGRKRSPVVIVEIDGEEFRVPVNLLDSFLESKRKEVKAEARQVAEQPETKVVPPAPKIEVIEVIEPSKETPVQAIKQKVFDTNKVLNDIWLGTIGRELTVKAKKRQKDEEDAIMLLFM